MVALGSPSEKGPISNDMGGLNINIVQLFTMNLF